MFKNVHRHMVAGVLAIAMLAGCQNSSGGTGGTGGASQPAGQSQQSVAATGEKQTIKLALWDYESIDYNKAMVEAFEAQNPDIKVEVLSSPNADYDNKLAVMLAGGDDIDVFFAKSNTQYPTLVLKNYCLPLDDLIAENNFDLEPFGTVLDQHYLIDGQLMAIPYRTNDWVMYYNKTIFDNAGVDYPSNNMTWEEFSEISKKVTSGEGADKIYGASFIPRAGFIVPFLVGKDPSFNIMTSSFDFLKGPIEYVLALQNEAKSYEEYAISKSMSQDQTYFYKGKSAMLYNGSWFTQMLVADKDKYDFEWGIAKSPYWEGTQQRGFATSTPICINSKTKKADLAWKLLSFMTGAEGSAIMAESMMVPSYMSENVMEVYREATQLDDSSFEALTDNATYAFGPPDALMGLISNVMNEEIELVITGNQSVDETIKNMEKRREETISQNS